MISENVSSDWSYFFWPFFCLLKMLLFGYYCSHYQFRVIKDVTSKVCWKLPHEICKQFLRRKLKIVFLFVGFRQGWGGGYYIVLNHFFYWKKKDSLTSGQKWFTSQTANTERRLGPVFSPIYTEVCVTSEPTVTTAPALITYFYQVYSPWV